MNFHDCAVGEPDALSADIANALAEIRHTHAQIRTYLGTTTWDLPDYEPAP